MMASILLTAASCRKSQFSTTSREVKNGKISYSNHPLSDRTKSPGLKPSHRPLTVNDAPVPASVSENFVASASQDPVIVSRTSNRDILQQEIKAAIRHYYGLKFHPVFPDTIKGEKQKTGPYKDHSGSEAKVIKFKDGQSKIATIISMSADSMTYQVITEDNIVRSIEMAKVDSILRDSRKNEPLGVIGIISSILGLVPLFGIPFAILGIIFGSRSLRKIRSHPERFKGQSRARASKAIGIVGLVISIVIIIISLASAAESCSHTHIRI